MFSAFLLIKFPTSNPDIFHRKFGSCCSQLHGSLQKLQGDRATGGSGVIFEGQPLAHFSGNASNRWAGFPTLVVICDTFLGLLVSLVSLVESVESGC